MSLLPSTRAALAVVLAAAALGLSAPALADEADVQVWTQLNVVKVLNAQTDATFELHGRLTDDVSRVGQILVRPSLTRKLPKGWSLTAGYVFVRTDFEGRSPNSEHRAWQQVGYTFHKNAATGLSLTGRTRLEQRFREGEGQAAYRLRQQLRAELPLPMREVRAVVWNETFFGLNDVVWGPTRDVDQTRTFVGLSLPVATGLRLEPGYELQNTFTTGSKRANHILAANLLARF